MCKFAFLKKDQKKVKPTQHIRMMTESLPVKKRILENYLKTLEWELKQGIFSKLSISKVHNEDSS